MRIAVVPMATMSLYACVGAGSTSLHEPADVTSACELATDDAAALDGRLVRFRSGFDVAVEHVSVVDAKCPQLMLFLHHAAGSNVDFTLCSEKDFRFGCPVHPDFEVKATFTGVFHAAKRGGFVDVISMSEIFSERDRK